MSNFIIAIIRTVIPYAVGWIAAQLALANIPIDPETVTAASNSLTVLLGSLYYIGVAWLERKWAWFGWLLGVARNPVYEPKHAA